MCHCIISLLIDFPGHEDPCYGNPCGDYGTCDHDGVKHWCKCAEGYAGEPCGKVAFSLLFCFKNSCLLPCYVFKSLDSLLTI